MLIVHIHVHVLPEHVEAFAAASAENAANSIQEPGILRFDVLQQVDDPTRFIFIEIYRDSDAAGAHKLTAHYERWRDAVAPMMAEPRTRVPFTNIYPDESRF